MHLVVTHIYNARRLVKDGEASEPHFAELQAYLRDEVQPKGFKFERNGNEVVVVGYCGEWKED